MKKSGKMLAETNKCCTFATQNRKLVPWMSGLVNGLQNRLQQFESARHLTKKPEYQHSGFFILLRSTRTEWRPDTRKQAPITATFSHDDAMKQAATAVVRHTRWKATMPHVDSEMRQ